MGPVARAGGGLEDGQGERLGIAPIVLGAAGKVGLASDVGALRRHFSDLEAVDAKRLGDEPLTSFDGDQDGPASGLLLDERKERRHVVRREIGAGGTAPVVADNGDAELAVSPVDTDGFHKDLRRCDAGKHLGTAASPVSLYCQRF